MGMFGESPEEERVTTGVPKLTGSTLPRVWTLSGPFSTVKGFSFQTVSACPILRGVAWSNEDSAWLQRSWTKPQELAV